MFLIKIGGKMKEKKDKKKIKKDAEFKTYELIEEVFDPDYNNPVIKKSNRSKKGN